MDKSIGAFWKKQGKKVEYLSGQIDLDEILKEHKEGKVYVIMFKNTDKAKPNLPDYTLYLSKQREIPEEKTELEPF